MAVRYRRGAGPYSDHPDPRGLCGLGRAFQSRSTARVQASAGEMLGAVFAAMAVQWTVARAVAIGLVKERVPFLRTAKGGLSRKGPDFPAFWEAVIGSLLLARRRHADRHQLQAGPRDQYFRLGLGGAKPALRRRRRARRDRGHAAEQLCVLAGHRGADRHQNCCQDRARAAVLLPQPQQVIAQMAEPPKLPADTAETVQ